MNTQTQKAVEDFCDAAARNFKAIQEVQDFALSAKVLGLSYLSEKLFQIAEDMLVQRQEMKEAMGKVCRGWESEITGS